MPATTANTSDQVLVGSSGTVYVGTPSLITAPTDSDSALDTDFTQLGFISEEGVVVQDSKDVTEIKAWQSPYPVRRLVTERAFQVSFSLEQWNWLTLPFAMGGGTLTEPGAGEYKYTPPDADDLDERSMVIQWSDPTAGAGTRDYRLYIPRGIVVEPVEFNVRRTENAMFPITFAAIFNGTDPIYSLFTDDPAFEVA